MTPSTPEPLAGLIGRLDSHMGLADIGDVLRDCRAASKALSAAQAQIDRLTSALAASQAAIAACLLEGGVVLDKAGNPNPWWEELIAAQRGNAAALQPDQKK